MESKSKVIRLNFVSSGFEMYRDWYKQLLMTVLTGGIYIFWWRASTRKNRLHQIKILNHSIECESTGMGLFDQFLQLFRYFGTAFLVVDAVRKSVESYQNWFIVLQSFIGVMGLIVYQYEGKIDFLKSLRWNNYSIQVEPQKLKYLQTYMHWTLLTVFSGGVLAPLRRFKLLQIQCEGLSVQGHRVSYLGDLKQFSILYWKGLGLTIFSLGLYFSWWRSSVHNYEIEHLRLRNFRLKSLVSGSDLFFQDLETVLLVLFTVGLAWPLVQNNRLKLRLRKTAFIEDRLSNEVTNYPQFASPEEKNLFPLESRV